MNGLSSKVFLSFLFLLPADCSPKFQSVEWEMHVRILAEEDSVLVFEIERGIFVDNEKFAAGAVEALDQMLEKRRLWPAEGGIVSFDFDEIGTRLVDNPEIALTPHEKKELEICSGISVEKTGLFLDDQRRLSLYRLWRIRGLRRAIDGLNEMFNAGILEQTPARPFVPSFPVFDEKTAELQRSRAAAGGPWLSAEADCVVLDVAMTRESAARCLSYLFVESNKPENAGLASFFEGLRSLEVSGDRAVLRFGPREDGWMRIFSTQTNGQYAPGVLEAWRAAGRPLDESRTLEQVREIMHRP